MREEKLSKKEKNFIKGYRTLLCPPSPSLSLDKVKEFNSRSISKKQLKKYLVKAPSSVDVTNYIIPTSDGNNISSSFFVSPKEQELKGAMPLVVYFHGGGWMFGNMDFYSSYLKYFASKIECAVLLVDYRLSPSCRFPTPIEDCYDALIWALDGLKYWKIDTDRVYVAGDGVGATMATSVLTLLRDRKSISVSGELLFYPLTDCRLRTESMEKYKETATLSTQELGIFIKNFSKELKDSLSPLMSPLLNVDLTRLPPTLIIGADKDPLHDDAVLYKGALENAQNKAKVLIPENSIHGFMPFKDAKGREESERVIWQFVSGRNIESIDFMNKKDFKKFKKTKEIIW